jgi:hypothetical protein
MNAKSFSTLAGALFLFGALVHATRLIWAWPIVIGGWNMPIWVSWMGLFVGATLGWIGLRAGSRG